MPKPRRASHCAAPITTPATRPARTAVHVESTGPATARPTSPASGNTSRVAAHWKVLAPQHVTLVGVMEPGYLVACSSNVFHELSLRFVVPGTPRVDLREIVIEG